jgi:hypothetical protein
MRCSCPLSTLLLRLVSVIDHSGRAMAQHDRHELMAHIMKRYFSCNTAPSHTECGTCSAISSSCPHTDHTWTLLTTRTSSIGS